MSWCLITVYLYSIMFAVDYLLPQKSPHPAGRLVRASALLGQRPAVLASGLDELDRLTGGFFLGEINELVASGPRAQILLYPMLAAACARGESPALIDGGDGFDIDSACRAGVVLSRIILVRPASWAEALCAAESLLASPGLRLVVLDGVGMKGRPLPAAALRLRGAARTGRGALVLRAPFALAGNLARMRLRVLGLRPRWRRGSAGAFLEGLSLWLRIERAFCLETPRLIKVELQA